MPVARNNAQFNVIKEFGSDGELAFIEVDYGNDVSAETGDFDAASAVSALGMVQRAIEQRVNILGKGPLADSNTRQTFIVRADALSRDSDTGNDKLEFNTIEASLQTAIRAIDTNFRGSTPGITANLSAATVRVKALDLQTAAPDDSTANN